MKDICLTSLIKLDLKNKTFTQRIKRCEKKHLETILFPENKRIFINFVQLAFSKEHY